MTNGKLSKALVHGIVLAALMGVVYMLWRIRAQGMFSTAQWTGFFMIALAAVWMGGSLARWAIRARSARITAARVAWSALAMLLGYGIYTENPRIESGPVYPVVLSLMLLATVLEGRFRSGSGER
jgi:hypothetical protein